VNENGGGIVDSPGDTEYTQENDKYVDFPTSYPVDGGLEVDTGDATPLLLNYDGFYLLIRVAGHIEVGSFKMEGSFGFEMGEDLIAVSATLSFDIKNAANEVIFGLSVDPAALMITKTGIAAQMNMGLTIGGATSMFAFEGDVTYYLNTTGVDVILIAGETVELEIPDGKTEVNKLKIGILKIKIGNFVKFEAINVNLDFTATGSEHLISFGDKDDGSVSISFGGSDKFGGWGGKVGNFAIGADWKFYLLPGFEAEVTGPSNTGVFGLPIPLNISKLGIKFNDTAISAEGELLHPERFTIVFSGGLIESGGWPITATVDGLEVDIEKLVNGQFPIVNIDGFKFGINDFSIGPVTVSGSFTFGLAKGTVDGEEVSAFYGGIEGKFTYSGIGGGIKLYVCEKGPLIATVSVGGLVLGPTGFVLGVDDGGFAWGGDPWPSVDGPEELLTTPVFQEPFDTSLPAIKARVMSALENDVFTWEESFTMGVTGTITNLYVQGMISGDVTLAANIDVPSLDDLMDPEYTNPSVKILINGNINALGMPLGFGALLFDFSDILAPQIDLAFKVPAPGNPLGFLFPMEATLGASLDTTGILGMPIVGIGVFVEEMIKGTMSVLLDGIAEDLEADHSDGLAKIILDADSDGEVSTEEDEAVIDGDFMVDQIVGSVVHDTPGILPLSFKALKLLTTAKIERAIDLIIELVPAIIDEVNNNEDFDWGDFLLDLADVVIDAAIKGLKEGWEAFDPSLRIYGKIQPVIFGIPLGEPDFEIELFMNKDIVSFGFTGSIRDLLASTMGGLSGILRAAVPSCLDGINDSTTFSFTLDLPDELITAIIAGLADDGTGAEIGLLDMLVDAINPFTGWEVLFASTITFFGFKLGSVSGFIFGPQENDVGDFDPTPTFQKRVVLLDMYPDDPDDNTPDPDKMQQTIEESNLIPVNTKEQYDNIVKYGGILMTGQLFMPDIIADPVAVLTTVPLKAETVISDDTGDFQLTITAVEFGPNFNDATILFKHEDGASGSEEAVWDESNPRQKVLLITVEDGVSTALDIAAAIDTDGTFTAVATHEDVIIDLSDVNPAMTSGGEAGTSLASLTVGSTSLGFAFDVKSKETGSDLNGVTVVFEDKVEAGQEKAFFDDTNPAFRVLRIKVEDGGSSAAQVVAAIDAEGTFDATVTTSGTIDIASVNPSMTTGGVSGIDWTLPESIQELSLEDLTDFAAIPGLVTDMIDYITQIIEGLTRQSEWAKLQVYVASPARLFDLGDYLDSAGAAHATVTRSDDNFFELRIESVVYGYDYNDVAIIFEEGDELGAVFDDSDPDNKTLTITVVAGETKAKYVAQAIEDEGTFTAFVKDEAWVVDISVLSSETTFGGFIEEKSTPIDIESLASDKLQELVDILSAGYIEGYSKLKLFGIELGETFIEGTIAGIAAEMSIPWLGGLKARLETGWKTTSRNQMIYDLVASPLASTFASAFGLGVDPAEFFSFLLDPEMDDWDIVYPVAAFEATMSSTEFMTWMSEQFGLPEEIVTSVGSVASMDFFFGAYTPGYGEPEDSGVKRNGGFRIEVNLNIENFIEDAHFEFEIEPFSFLGSEDLATFLIPNFVARASVANLSIPGLIPGSNLLTITDLFLEIIKDSDGLHFELECTAMLLGLRLTGSGEFDFSDEGLYGGIILELVSGVQSWTSGGDEDTPASAAVRIPGTDNDFRIDSVLGKASATVTSSENDFELFIEAVAGGSHLNSISIEFEDGTALTVDDDISDGTLTITVVDGTTTAGEIATAITTEGTFTASAINVDSIVDVGSLDLATTSGGTSGAGQNGVKVRMIDDDTITGGAAYAEVRSGEIVITVKSGETRRSAAIVAVNALEGWTVGAEELTDGDGDGIVILSNELADLFDFELEAHFLLLINTTEDVQTITWRISGEDKDVELDDRELRIHADGFLRVGGFRLEGTFDFVLNVDGLKVTVAVSVELGPLGYMLATGLLIIDSQGLVGRIVLELDVGTSALGNEDVGINIYGLVLLEINIGPDPRTVTVWDFADPDGIGDTGALVEREVTIDPGVLILMQGRLDFLGMLEASASITLEIRSDKFYLGGRAELILEPDLLTIEATFDVQITADGLTMGASVSVDANIAGVLTILASGKLLINTVDEDVTLGTGANAITYPANSFLLDLNGEVRILEVLTFEAGFKIQVGGGTFTHTGSAAKPAGSDAYLGAGEWAVSFHVGIDFFGIIELDADGWFNYEGHFGIYLGGDLVIGTRSFGIIGDFDIYTSYNGSVFTFSGSASAKIVLFGWDVAGVTVSFNYNSSTGKITIRGEIHLDFWLFSVDVGHTFTIGYLKLPEPVYLASSTTGRLVNGDVDADGNLYLNIGPKGSRRNLANAETNETVYVSHVSGNASSSEGVRVKCFGRSAKYTGVKKIIAEGSDGTDLIVIEQGVVSPVSINGGAGNDVIVHQGPGGGTGNVIHGGPGEDYIELGSAVTVGVSLYGDEDNDYIVGGPNADSIWGGSGDDQILGMSGADTIRGGTGHDLITGGPDGDTLYGNAGQDTFYWSKADGPDRWFDGGAGDDDLVLTAGDDNEDITISPNGVNFEVKWLGESLTLTGISVESLDLNLGEGSDDLVINDTDGTCLTSVELYLGGDDNLDPIAADAEWDGVVVHDSAADTVLLEAGSGNDTYVLDGAGGIIGVDRTGVLLVIINSADRDSGDELTIETYGGSDTINAAAVTEDLIAMTFDTSTGDDILIGTPFDDVLDSGTGSDTVSGHYGTDTFIDSSGAGDVDTLVEYMDTDMSLFDDLFVHGTILGDDGGTFFKSSIIDEQNADPEDPMFPAPVVFSLEDRGDVYASGADVEDLTYNGEPIFERAYLHGGDGNNVMVIGDIDGTITVGGVDIDVDQWTGEATLDNGANRGAGGDEHIEYYILNLTGTTGSKISIVDSGGSDGYDEICIYGTESADRITLNAVRDGAEVSGIVIVGEPETDTLVQKVTVISGVETYLYYLHDAGGERVQRTDDDGELIYDMADPENPDPIYLETTTDTGDPVMVNAPNPDRDDVTFRYVERVTVRTLGGDDILVSHDTSVATVIELGDGEDLVIVGTVPQINDPGNRTPEYLLGIPVADIENVTNGNTAVMTIYGGEDDDEFEVNHNMAQLFLHGGAGDDTFIINTFLTLKDSDDPDEITNLSTLFGGAGNDRYEYLQNAPVTINGGTGTDTIVVTGTPIRDIFIVTDKYIAGAGRMIYFTNVERIAVNSASGADEIYVLSSSADLEVVVRGGSGDDTIHVGGDPPTMVQDPPPYTYQAPAYQVQDPPVAGYREITWDLSWITVTKDWNWWTHNFGSTDARTAVRDYLNTLVTVMRTFIPGLEVTDDIDDIVDQTSISYSVGYGRWWIFDPEVYVTFNPAAFDLRYPTMELPPPRTVVPDPVTIDPAPYAFKADRTFDLSGIMGKVIIDGGDAYETDGDQVIIHNQDGAAKSGVLTDIDLTGFGLGIGIEYEDLENMVIMLGNGDDTLTIEGTHEGTVDVSLGGGDDTANIEAIAGETKIMGGDGDDVFNVADDPEMLGGILEDLTIEGDSGLLETITIAEYLSDYDVIETMVFINTEPDREFVDDGGNKTEYALEEKSRIVFDNDGELWVYVVVLDPDTGRIIEDMVQERNGSGTLLWLDNNGEKTTSNPGGYAPSLIPVNRTKAVAHTRSEIVATSGPGDDTLNVYDPLNEEAVTATLTSTTLAVTSMPGLIIYDLNELGTGADVVNVYLGSGDDVFNVKGTDVTTNLMLNDGDERIYISDAAALDTGARTDMLAGTLDDITGDLNVYAGNGRHELMVSDFDSSAGDGDVLITDSHLEGLPDADISVTGLAPAAITYTADPEYGNFAGGITYWTGSGDDTVHVDGTHRRDMSDAYGNDIRTVTTLNTNEGDDTVTVDLDSATDGFFVLNTEEDEDVVDATASTLGMIIIGGIGTLDMIDGGEGDDVIFGDRGRVYYLDALGDVAIVIGNGGPGDITDGIAHAYRLEVQVDLTVGGVDIVDGKGGDDIIYGEIGDDILFGGLGNDEIFGYDGDDVIIGDKGRVVMPGGVVELIETTDPGTGGDDVIEGNDGDDIILGGFGSDIVNGDDGNDIILGDNGLIDLDTEDGDPATVDLIQTASPTLGGDDILDGDDGHDILLGGAGPDTLSGYYGNDILLGDNGRLELMDGHIYLIATTAPGEGGDDTLHGDGDDDVILGGHCEDDITGNDGDDIILGDNGLLDYDTGDGDPSTLDLIETTDPTLGCDDTIDGNLGNDILMGGAASDTMYGSYGDDILIGDGGRIVLVAGAISWIGTNAPDLGGADLMQGDDGKDILLGGAAGDDINGNDGNDIVLGDNGMLDRDTGDGDTTTLDLIETTDPTLGDADDVDGDSGDDILLGGAASDLITGDLGDDIIMGDGGSIVLESGVIVLITTNAPTEGDGDTIFGNEDDDIILGGYGGDDIDAGDGDNVVLGDNGRIDYTIVDGDPSEIDRIWTTEPGVGGADTIVTGDGEDIVMGGADGDDIHTNAANDIVLGDNGLLDYVSDDGDPSDLDLVTTTYPNDGDSDDISCGDGNDIVMGGTASETIHGGFGNDLLFGDHGMVEGDIEADLLPLHSLYKAFVFRAIDTQNGDDGGADLIYGDEGDDIILGQQGADTLYGGSGDDDIIGGHNVSGGHDTGDRIDGGSGNDVICGDNAEVLRAGSPLSPRFAEPLGPIYDPDDEVQLSPVMLPDPVGTEVRQITLLDHTLSVQEGMPLLYGDDYIAGGADDDHIFGQLGGDIIQGDGTIDEVVWAERIEGDLIIDPSYEGSYDGDDYIEGNGGDDVVFGNLGQDDIVGGNSAMYSLSDPGDPAGDKALRPDGSDLLFGGCGTAIDRNDLGDAEMVDYQIVTAANGHAFDADVIVGDNANIYRLVSVYASGGDPETGFLWFNYDKEDPDRQDTTPDLDFGDRWIIPRAVELIDYTTGGVDHYPTMADVEGDLGAADEIHGEAGDDLIYGMVGDDVLFGEGQDDDLVGGYGNDWISGGTGQDGVLGDDGRIYTSRNGVAEPLHGIGPLTGELDLYIYSPGKIQESTINVTGELKKTVNITPFKLGDPEAWDYAEQDPLLADDIIYGGWGGDFLHGCAGDDAVSGAEALPMYYEMPYNPGDVLKFGVYRGGEFGTYDEYDPWAKVMWDPVSGEFVTEGGEQFLLNFDRSEGPADEHSAGTAYGPYPTDGDDRIFGDLGNDWLVGGSGRDHLYGGYGYDLLNADDDHDSTLGTGDDLANNVPDTHPSYEDIVYGGAGRDVLIANTGGDRLIDWAGEFNSYLVPFAPFGMATVSRALQPGLMEYLYDLSASDGADPTRAADTGADPDRNGEPEGELGLVKQSDFEWQDQTGAPDDPQPGNVKGGKRDVLRSATFNSGTFEGFFTDSGVFTVENAALSVSAESLGEDAASVFHVDEFIPTYFELRATITAVKPTAGWKSNAFVIFDYQNEHDFKFAGINVGIDKVQMGRRTETGWIVDVQAKAKTKPGVAYNMLVAINGTVVTVVLDGKELFSYAFDPRVDDDGYVHGLNAGMVGFGSDNSRGTFDNMAVQVLEPEITFEDTEDFPDTSIDMDLAQEIGEWSSEDGRYSADPSDGGIAVSLLGIEGLDSGVYVASLLGIKATLNTEGTAGLVFDYYGPDNFKFAAIRADTDELVIGHYTAKAGWVDDAVVSTDIIAGTDYEIELSLKGSTVSLSVRELTSDPGNFQAMAGFVYNSVTVDGSFGLFAQDGAGSFDSIYVKTDDPVFRE